MELINKTCLALLVLLLSAGCKQPANEARQITRERTAAGTAAGEIEKSIYRSGDSMLAAFKRRDWKTFVQYNHPNMTKRMGGPEAFASFMAMQVRQLPENTVKNISLGKILQVVKTQADLQCVVEQNIKMQLNGNDLDKTTYLVGESLDNGNHWTFFDASTKTGVSPKDIKPNISNELKIPAAKNEIN